MGVFSQAQLAHFKKLSEDLSGVAGDVTQVSSEVTAALGALGNLSVEVAPLLTAMTSLSAVVTSLSDTVTVLSTRAVPVGAVVAFAGGTPPEGWLECDGSQCLISSYPALAEVLGDTYGVPDDPAQFYLPDLRGVFVRGWSHDRPGIDPFRVRGTQQASAVGPHTHSIKVSLTATSGSNRIGIDSVGALTRNTEANDGVAETRPINLALMYCIKY